MQKYIKISDIKNFTPSCSEYNTVEISTHFVKGTGLVAYIQEGKLDTSRGYESFGFDIFGSKKTRVLIAGMTRKNQKKIEEETKNFFEEKTNQDFINTLNINNQK